MAKDLFSKHLLRRVIGKARLQRLIRAGWLVPAEHTPTKVMFRPTDVHAALRRLERQACPPDKLEVARVRLSELRNGHPRVRKEKPLKSLDFELDFSAIPEIPVYD